VNNNIGLFKNLVIDIIRKNPAKVDIDELNEVINMDSKKMRNNGSK
jgi:hypothetical protein